MTTGRAHAVVLLLFGVALTRVAAGDMLLQYVRPVMRPYVLAAGLVTILLSSALFVGHAPRQPMSSVGWLAVAPVAVLMIVAPPALGTFSASRDATAATASEAHYPPLPPGTSPLSLADYSGRSRTDGGATLTGRTVLLTGFVLGAADGGFVLSRLVITCCAADARPVDVAVLAVNAPPQVGSWVAVTGHYAMPAGSMPALRASSVRPVAQPRNPYDG